MNMMESAEDAALNEALSMLDSLTPDDGFAIDSDDDDDDMNFNLDDELNQLEGIDLTNGGSKDEHTAAAAAAAGVCSDGQIYVVNNCGATLKHGDVKGTKTIQSGCQDLSGPGQRIWVGSDDSTVYSQHITLFEYSYWSPGHNGDFQLSWDVSLLTGYNYPVKVENNGQTLLDVTGPSCGGVREGLFPCSQKANACVENSYKWQPICAGCNSSCCDTSDKEHDCNPPDIDNTQNMVLTFCPNEPTNLFAIQPATTPASPEAEQTYCGCPQCTQAVWDTLACGDALDGCHTCGSRISWLQSNNGGNADDACKTVSEQFSTGPCGVCNPLLCNNPVLDDPDPTKLIWSDEFNVDGVPDPSKWSFDYGDGCDVGLCGWGNNELQYYTSDNAVVANGVLRISAKKEAVGGRDYSSTRMVTRGKQAFRYGRIQFRARTAGCTARGTWPALWALPEEWVYGGWPNSGEIDVMEAVGYEENKFHGSVHTGAYNHGIGTQKTASVIKSELDWHIFEIDWQEDKIMFAVNGEVYFTFAPDYATNSAKWPFNQDFHLLLNIAVGGMWGAVEGVDAAAFEGDGQYMELDWVRVYSS
mmetsp:Transcript_22404/g.34596  ORF Transcript_22404/g.34596 Transcript_22404/m.34596 type:complete len:585 (-) Transcript_22404:45-1799(-)